MSTLQVALIWKEDEFNRSSIMHYLTRCSTIVTSMLIHVLAFGTVPCRADDLFALTVLETDLGFAHGVFAVADINGDGRKDIVGAGSEPRLWWAPDSTPAHRIAIAAQAAAGFALQCSDVDWDGDIDVLTSAGGLTWWENPLYPAGDPAHDIWQRHTCGFGAVQTTASTRQGGTHDFVAGDINGDGRIDAVERHKEDVWTVYLQEAGTDTVSFSVHTIDVPHTIEGTALGDIDDDGDLDLSDGRAWYSCPADPRSGTWQRRELAPCHDKTRVVIADINGDGREDIVVAPAEFGGSSTVWFEAPQDPLQGTWISHTLITRNDPNFHTLQVGDVDWDGHDDIVLGTTGYHDPPWGKRVLMLLNTAGDATVWDTLQWETAYGVWQGVLGDVHSDGDLDLLTANYQEGAQAELWENLAAQKSYLRILSPETDACFHQGDTLAIQWWIDTLRVRNALYIDVSFNSMVSYAALIEDANKAISRDCTSIYSADTGTYHWVVPDSITDNLGTGMSTVSDCCLVRIEEAYGSRPDGKAFTAITDHTFAVRAPGQPCGTVIRSARVHGSAREGVHTTRHIKTVHTGRGEDRVIIFRIEQGHAPAAFDCMGRRISTMPGQDISGALQKIQDTFH
jgi:hypothetical protein